MTLALSTEPRSSTVQVDEIVNLVEIFRDEVNCCVLRRSPPPGLGDFLEAFNTPLRVQQAVDCNETLLPQIVHALPGEMMALAGMDAFLRDVADVVEIYATLLGADQVGMRLVTLDRAMCPGFHVDRVGIRLVCTYRGPATQWLDNDRVDRAKLGLIAEGSRDEESGLIRDGGVIRAMRPFDVGLLKGETWLKRDGSLNEGNGVVHRSPPPVGEGLRLLLTLDAL